MSPSPSRHRPVRLGARALGGVAIAAALALAGCGGDSDSGGAPTAPATSATATPARTATTADALSHAQLVSRADAACAEAAQAIAGVPAAGSLDALADYAASVRRIGDDLRDRLGALTPGASDEAAFGKYLDGIDASNAALDAMRTAARDGDADGVRAAAQTIDQTAIGVLATRAGLPGCAATATAPGGAGS